MSSLELLKECENILDQFNFDKGTKFKKCIYCGAIQYDGDGIIHDRDCLLVRLREKILNDVG